MSAGPSGNDLIKALTNAMKPFDPRIDPNAVGTMSDFERAQYLEYLKKAQEAGLNVGAQQQSLADALLARSEGRGGPSIAELQLGRTLEQNKRDLAGQIGAAGRSINPALARSLLIQQQAKMAQQTAGEGALLRAKEQAEAQTALANQLAQMRTAEQNAAQTAGSLGLQQEKLAVETQEAQKQREYDAAAANQAAERDWRKSQMESSRQSRKDVGSFLTEAGKVASLFNAGGVVATRYAEGGKVKDPRDAKLEEGLSEDEKKKMYRKGSWRGENPSAVDRIVNRVIDLLGASHEPAQDRYTRYASNKAEILENKEKDPSFVGPPQPKGMIRKQIKKEVGYADGGSVNAAMGKLTKMDNEKNDVVPAMLSPGEIVLPRSIVAAPNAPVAAAKFVEALLANKDKKDAKMVALKAALGKK